MRGKGGSGIEQAEITRMGHVDEAVFHRVDGPREDLIERAWPVKVEEVRVHREKRRD